MLTDEGFIVLTKTQPIRYARECAEKNGTSLGEEYFAQGTYTYRTGWNQDIALTKNTYTMSDLLNTFRAAGLWIEMALEPHLSEDAARRYPQKQQWMNNYLGIIIFKLRPISNRWGRRTRDHPRTRPEPPPLGTSQRTGAACGVRTERATGSGHD